MNMELKALVKDLAPALGNALMGPLGGVALSFLADKLGVEQKTVEAVTNAITDGKMTPEQVTSLKLAEVEFQKFCQQNNIDLEKIAADDRNSARLMQATTRSRMPATLTVMITLGFFGVLGFMLHDKSAVDSAPLMIMLGSLGTAWTGCCAYWFGTTNGSQNKTELIHRSTPKY